MGDPPGPAKRFTQQIHPCCGFAGSARRRSGGVRCSAAATSQSIATGHSVFHPTERKSQNGRSSFKRSRGVTSWRRAAHRRACNRTGYGTLPIVLTGIWPVYADYYHAMPACASGGIGASSTVNHSCGSVFWSSQRRLTLFVWHRNCFQQRTLRTTTPAGTLHP